MRKERTIRYISFTIGMVSLSCGVVFLFAKVTIPAIVCLTLAVVAIFFAFVPYPWIKHDKENTDDDDYENFR